MATAHNSNEGIVVNKTTAVGRTELAAESVRKGAVIGMAGGGMASMAYMAAALAVGAERTKLEEEAGAEPVGELSELVKVDEQAKLEATIKLVDRMNKEMAKNESLEKFLMGLNNLILKAGKPIPRKILLQNGTHKKDLNRLVQEGLLRETYLRHGHNGTLYTCLALPDGVTFYGRQAVAIVREPDVKEDVAQSIRDGLGGVDEVVGHMDGPAPAVSRGPVGD